MDDLAFDGESEALFLDIDGTLLDIAARPGDVSVPATLKDSLRALARRAGGALALVSGRAIRDIDRLFGDLKPRAAGCHGGELRLLPGGDIFMAAAGRLPETIMRHVTRLGATHRGLLIEDKGLCVAVHYRGAPTLGPALRHELESLIARSGETGLTILPGRLVYEIKRADTDKGAAVEAFMRQPPFAGRRPLFIGDDITDIAGFRAAIRHGGRAWAVGRDLGPARRRFGDAAEVRAWLHAEARKAADAAARPAAPA
ncbi:trehalose-phosphatase, partial [Camelimonas abortus]